MISKQQKQQLKEWSIQFSIYILISIPCALLLQKVMELKYTKIFWSYFAVMGISAIIAEFYTEELEYKNKRWVRIIAHIAYISFLTLMMWWFLHAVGILK